MWTRLNVPSTFCSVVLAQFSPILSLKRSGWQTWPAAARRTMAANNPSPCPCFDINLKVTLCEVCSASVPSTTDHNSHACLHITCVHSSKGRNIKYYFNHTTMNGRTPTNRLIDISSISLKEYNSALRQPNAHQQVGQNSEVVHFRTHFFAPTTGTSHQAQSAR